MAVPKPRALDLLLVDDGTGPIVEAERTMRGRHVVRIALSVEDAVKTMNARRPDALVCLHGRDLTVVRQLLSVAKTGFPGVLRVLATTATVSRWHHLVEKGLVHHVLPSVDVLDLVIK